MSLVARKRQTYFKRFYHHHHLPVDYAVGVLTDLHKLLHPILHHVQVIVRPVDPNDAFDVYIAYEYDPKYRPNITHHDYMDFVPKPDLSHLDHYESLETRDPLVQDELRYTVTVPSYLTLENGTYWVGVKLKSKWKGLIVGPKHYFVRLEIQKTVNTILTSLT